MATIQPVSLTNRVEVQRKGELTLPPLEPDLSSPVLRLRAHGSRALGLRSELIPLIFKSRVTDWDQLDGTLGFLVLQLQRTDKGTCGLPEPHELIPIINLQIRINPIRPVSLENPTSPLAAPLTGSHGELTLCACRALLCCRSPQLCPLLGLLSL